ncbi:putative reverse transcriptase domain-containing protein [Tanacetum coccineum]
MVTMKYKKIERYIWELPERIQGNVTSSKPATTHEAICMAYNLMDQAVRFKAARTPTEWKVYAGNLPLGNRCKLLHNGQCTVMCRNCQKVGHQSKDCKSKNPATGSNT